MKPLFKWAGGKTRMIPKYEEHLPTTFDVYFEPFLGGGAMFCWAYAKNPDARFVLNDINEELIEVYRMIKEAYVPFKTFVDNLCEAYLPLEKDLRKKFYYALRQKNIEANYTGARRSAMLFFLLSTSFNGIWQTKKDAKGRFATPCGLLNEKTKADIYDEENLLSWHHALQKAFLFSEDYNFILSHVQAGDFVFLDPPYRGAKTTYGQDFNDGDHSALLKKFVDLEKKGSHVLLCGKDTDDGFFDAFANRTVFFDVTHTAGRRKKTEEGFEAKKAKEFLIHPKKACGVCPEGARYVCANCEEAL